MAITKPPVLPAWADAGDKVQPSNAELSTGWPLSAIPPSRQRFNWILNYCANAVRYFARRGLPDYDAAEIYMTGDRVLGAEGKTYVCTSDNTLNTAPPTNPSKWMRWGYTQNELAQVVSASANDHTAASDPHPQYAKGLDVVRTNAIQLQFNVANTRHSWRALLA